MPWIMMSPLITRIIVVIAVLTALVGGGWYLHHSGYQSGYAAAEQIGEAKLTAYREEQRKQLDEFYAKQRQLEADLQKKMQDSLMEKENEIKAINARHAALVSSLQQRPSRNSTTPVVIETPTITTFECTRVPGTGEGLSREDGEFLAGEAASADILRQALKQCRASYERLLEKQLE